MPDVIYTPTKAPGEHYYLVDHCAAGETEKHFPVSMFLKDMEVPQEYDHLEIWGTTFSYPGDDNTLWRFLKGGKVVKETVLPRY